MEEGSNFEEGNPSTINHSNSAKKTQVDVMSFPAIEDSDEKLVKDLDDVHSSIHQDIGRNSPENMVNKNVSPKIYRSCEPTTEYRKLDSRNEGGKDSTIEHYQEDDEDYNESSQNNTQMTDQSPPRESQHLRSQYQNKSKLRQSINKGMKKPE